MTESADNENCTHWLPWRYLPTSYLGEFDLTSLQAMLFENDGMFAIALGETSLAAEDAIWDWVEDNVEAYIEIASERDFLNWEGAEFMLDHEPDCLCPDHPEHLPLCASTELFRYAVAQREIKALGLYLEQISIDLRGDYYCPDLDFRDMAIGVSGEFLPLLRAHAKVEANCDWSREAPSPYWLPYDRPRKNWIMQGWGGLFIWLNAAGLIEAPIDRAIWNAGVLSCIDEINEEAKFLSVDEMLSL